MEIISLSAKKRSVKGKQVKGLRIAGLVPAVVYGHGIDSVDIAVDYREFEKVLSQAGESTLIDLAIDGVKPVKVLVQEIQRDPLRGQIIHADLRQVNMTEKLEADVFLKLVGEAPAVKVHGAIIITNLDKATVKCLPGNLVHEIEVDLSLLKEFGDHITIGDLVPPPGVEFMDSASEVIVVATEPVSEEEEARRSGTNSVVAPAPVEEKPKAEAKK